MNNRHFDETTTLGNQCIQSINSVKSRIWLVFSLYYFIPLIYMPYDRMKFGLLILIYIVFLALY